MDGIQPLSGVHSGPPGHSSSLNHLHLPNGPAKSTADYMHALRRRIWLVLIVALVVSVAGSIWALRRPPVYKAAAQVLIEPPQFDALSSSFFNQQIARHDSETIAKYVPNRLALLRSRGLADRVMAEPSLARSGGAAAADPASEIIGMLQTRQVPGTNFFDIFLEGMDPARTTLVLNTLLHVFKQDASLDNSRMLNAASGLAEQSLASLKNELVKLDKAIDVILQGSAVFAPGGKNLIQDQYVLMNNTLFQKRMRHEDLQHQARLAEMFPRTYGQRSAQADPEVGALLQQKRKLTMQMAHMRRLMKPSRFDSDPAARYTANQLQNVMEQLEALQADAESVPDATALSVARSEEEMQKLDEEVKNLLRSLQETMPNYQKYLSMLEERERLEERMAAMQTRLSDFDMLTRARKEPVTIVLPATEPTTPVRPNRPLLIALFVAGGILAGGALVWLLEHLDHSVKAPEHLTAGLTLPLFGVIPRMRRLAKVHRGGHLWTPGAPGSLEADAYRNLRASLLAATGARGPIQTLLVTSAKPGEGKSTTALNLAATCARAGERTLLMDVDLRRPSLADVFDSDDGERFGLVEILHGDLPWQRTLVRTDLPNLDFLPTGETQDVPIEILGTLELRQLLAGLSRHYDRIILDGPAILGMADCRMLGRIVDAALLVVRCGAHDLRPLRRAKQMLELSQVTIAGVVFNGLSEDLKNWSSYGTRYGYGERDSREVRGLPSPEAEDEMASAAAE